ncbi:MAG: DNA methyltransferase [Fimbriimonadales bacterium]|nr:DNA methyltransferase [Fimbriimonadales bacterium]
MNSPSRWTLFFKLRNNIALDGDLQLAERELRLLTRCVVAPVNAAHLQKWLHEGKVLPKDVVLHREGVVGYTCEADRVDLERLFWRLSFCEQVFGVVPNDSQGQETIARIPAPFLRLQRCNQHLLLMFVPFSAFAEWSDVIARRARSPKEVEAALSYLCTALVNATPPELPQTVRSILSAKQTTGHLFHGLHVYKAKFFPRMARAFLNLCDGATVLDPFSGSGTALVEAAVMGIHAIGVDIDPLSVAIAQAKADLLNEPDRWADATNLVLERLDSSSKAQKSLFEIAESRTPYNLTPAFLRKRVPEPTLREVENDVACILESLRGLPPCSPLHIALSDALSRKFKFRFLGLGYGRFSLNIQPRRLRLMFIDNLRYMQNAIAAWRWLKAQTRVSLTPVTVLHGDARQLPLEDESVESVVTSPPYMPASSGRESYLKSKAYALTALGLIDPNAVDAYEAEQIGSVQRAETLVDLPQSAREVVEWMQNDPTRSVKAAATACYFADLRESLREIRRVLKPRGVCAYVVARQHVFYRYQSREVVRVVENADITAELAQQAGLTVLEQIHVELQKQNTVARPRSLDSYYETIVLLQKL